jgi:hypothetical protein
VLVELGLVEQRYKAVSEVLVDGATVTEVARRLGVSRQTVCRAPARWDHPSVSGMGPLHRGVNVGGGMIAGLARGRQAGRRRR